MIFIWNIKIQSSLNVTDDTFKYGTKEHSNQSHNGEVKSHHYTSSSRKSSSSSSSSSSQEEGQEMELELSSNNGTSSRDVFKIYKESVGKDIAPSKVSIQEHNQLIY